MQKSEASWSERTFIEKLQNKGVGARAGVIVGIGDDCAVIKHPPDSHLLITTDMLVEKVHFDLSWHPARKLGMKCIAVNLSDVAAMGGEPLYAFVSLAIPDHTKSAWLQQFMDGVTMMLQKYDCALIGGDTVSSEKLTVNVTIVGTTGKKKALLRNSAAPGQKIYVSGPLGYAAAGLALCKKQRKETFFDDELFEMLREQHLVPEPEIPLGQVLRASGCVAAMQDLSDGIATDLAHICTASDVQGILYQEKLPGRALLDRVCRDLDADPVALQLSGGEDYRLVFTVRTGKDEELIEILKKHDCGPVYCVGEIHEGKGLFLKTADGSLQDISYHGFEHTGLD